MRSCCRPRTRTASRAWRRRCALDAGCPLLGVVSDLGPGFANTHRDHFGAVPFQACRVHFDRRLDSDIPKFSWSKKAPLYAEFKDRIRAVLYADSIDEARTLLRDLAFERARFKGTGRIDSLRALERNFDLYTAHHFAPGLPADNNVTENVIKQPTRSSGSWKASAASTPTECYVRLLVGCYRFKRVTDSCREANKGKAPLELAGVDIAGRDRLSFLLNR